METNRPGPRPSATVCGHGGCPLRAGHRSPHAPPPTDYTDPDNPTPAVVIHRPTGTVLFVHAETGEAIAYAPDHAAAIPIMHAYLLDVRWVEDSLRLCPVCQQPVVSEPGTSMEKAAGPMAETCADCAVNLRELAEPTPAALEELRELGVAEALQYGGGPGEPAAPIATAGEPIPDCTPQEAASTEAPYSDGPAGELRYPRADGCCGEPGCTATRLPGLHTCLGHAGGSEPRYTAEDLRSAEEMGYRRGGGGLATLVLRPRIVCVCGSSRFVEEIAVQAWLVEKGGAIALAIHLLPASYTDQAHHQAEHEGVAEAMDRLHLRKIDLADSLLVVNVGGYIGDSTTREIAYARGLGKPVFFTQAVGVGG